MRAWVTISGDTQSATWHGQRHVMSVVTAYTHTHTHTRQFTPDFIHSFQLNSLISAPTRWHSWLQLGSLSWEETQQMLRVLFTVCLCWCVSVRVSTSLWSRGRTPTTDWRTDQDSRHGEHRPTWPVSHRNMTRTTCICDTCTHTHSDMYLWHSKPLLYLWHTTHTLWHIWHTEKRRVGSQPATTFTLCVCVCVCVCVCLSF